jgi:hypothetical protein
MASQAPFCPMARVAVKGRQGPLGRRLYYHFKETPEGANSDDNTLNGGRYRNSRHGWKM